MEDSKKLLNNIDISIIIPAFNLEKRIIMQLRKLETLFNSSVCANIHYEIIIINDGSTDNTLDFLRKEAQSDSHVKLITYSQNKGKGFAVKEGILKSTGKLTMLLDGDCDISLDSLSDYLNEIKHWDLLIGSKRHPLSNVRLPLVRRFLSRVFNMLVRFILDIEVKDTQVGLKLANGTIFRQIFNHIHIDRYAFDVELLTIVSLLKLKVREMPIDITVESQFKVNEMMKMFLDVLLIAYRYRIARSYKVNLSSKSTTFTEKRIVAE